MEESPIYITDFHITEDSKPIQIINKDSNGICYFIIPSKSNNQIYQINNSDTQPFEQINISQTQLKDNGENKSLFERIFTSSISKHDNNETIIHHFVRFQTPKQNIVAYCYDEKILFINTSRQISKVHLLEKLRQLAIVGKHIICLYHGSVQMLDFNGSTVSCERFPKPTFSSIFKYLVFNTYLSIGGKFTLTVLSLSDYIRPFRSIVIENPNVSKVKSTTVPIFQIIEIYGAIVCFVYFPFSQIASFLIIDNTKRINKRGLDHIDVEVQASMNYIVFVVDNLVLLTNGKQVSLYDFHNKEYCILQNAKCSFEMKDSIENNIYNQRFLIDQSNGCIRKFNLEYYLYYKIVEQKMSISHNKQTIKSVRNLLRRNGAGSIAIDVLSQMIDLRYDLSFMSKVLVAILRMNKKKEQCAIDLDKLKYQILLNLPIDGEYEIVQYSIDLMLEYIQVWLASNEHPEVAVLLRLIEALDKIKQYSILLNLITFGVFPDNEIIATQIIFLKNKYNGVFQLGLDMLKRLEKHQTICYCLNYFGMQEEARRYAFQHKVNWSSVVGSSNKFDNVLFDYQLHQLDQPDIYFVPTTPMLSRSQTSLSLSTPKM
ncbi:hypothetical protein KM1_196690 [Entamoeba histolytica HM-3:IMSS]|uniref:Mic1 domain-containing protein n=3 Tax=Entamoeba histolytica TaxID=5759 RepID=A0A175JEI5_ENTHI|nr:Hypothetical protein EHI5A_151890 [Entamoeba histolytica KU27]EMS11426.1 hypothetical protein KM1_196690 [Entamoeba histolytica HM-3:IMSS]GAT91873.1 hypothetical protein CL6EHI_011860 [Entamoeba histolytica]